MSYSDNLCCRHNVSIINGGIPAAVNSFVGFTFSRDPFDGNRYISVVLTACFEPNNRDSGVYLRVIMATVSRDFISV